MVPQKTCCTCCAASDFAENAPKPKRSIPLDREFLTGDDDLGAAAKAH
jgi:hypothetical protein